MPLASGRWCLCPESGPIVQTLSKPSCVEQKDAVELLRQWDHPKSRAMLARIYSMVCLTEGNLAFFLLETSHSKSHARFFGRTVASIWDHCGVLLVMPRETPPPAPATLSLHAHRDIPPSTPTTLPVTGAALSSIRIFLNENVWFHLSKLSPYK